MWSRSKTSIIWLYFTIRCIFVQLLINYLFGTFITQLDSFFNCGQWEFNVVFRLNRSQHSFNVHVSQQGHENRISFSICQISITTIFLENLQTNVLYYERNTWIIFHTIVFCLFICFNYLLLFVSMYSTKQIMSNWIFTAQWLIPWKQGLNRETFFADRSLLLMVKMREGLKQKRLSNWVSDLPTLFFSTLKTV